MSCCSRTTSSPSKPPHAAPRLSASVGRCAASSCYSSTGRSNIASKRCDAACTPPLCAPALHPRSAPLLCTPALHPRSAPLLCTPALRPCSAPLLCTPALHPCSAPLLCAPALHPCSAPLLCTLALHPRSGLKHRLPSGAVPPPPAPPPPPRHPRPIARQVLLTVPALRDLMLMLLLVFVVFSLFAVSFFGDLPGTRSTTLSTTLHAANASADASDLGSALERNFGDGFHSFTNAFLSLFSLWSTDNYPRVCSPSPHRPQPGCSPGTHPLPLPPTRSPPHPELLAGDRPNSAHPQDGLRRRRPRHLLLPQLHPRLGLHDHLRARRGRLRDLYAAIHRAPPSTVPHHPPCPTPPLHSFAPALP